ncbi:stalk domain-containing protein [Paenibacillus herberti]|uniref:Copper amine oxidase n=1 Tax=Paenibacillus herberti TaxID=1619309 RepID=A0A229NW93_9BACL|nr:stalk domain-containing protein [Paenibacillus herberti]OXM14141.1 copper amine oxidase [Paenibacillus herberti]
MNKASRINPSRAAEKASASKRVAGAAGARSFLTRRVLVSALGAALIIQPLAALAPQLPGVASILSPVRMASAATSGLTATNEEMITAGVQRIDYIWKGTRSGAAVQSNVHVIKIDLSNPYVKLNAINNKEGVVTDRGSVLNMTKNSGAVAGINADYFQTASSDGAPMGAQINGGMLLTSPMQLTGMYMFGVTKDRKAIIDRYSFEGSVASGSGNTFPLAGMNQSSYTTEYPSKGFSHADAMYIYTSAWMDPSRPAGASYATPTEVLVQGGVVQQISEGTALTVTPPADGYILRAHGKAAQFVRDNLQVGQQANANYSLKSLTTQQNVDPASFETMVGGHTILVENGQAATFSRSVSSVSGTSPRSRTAAGYSRDGGTVYLVTAEDNGTSTGLTLAELQSVLVELGAAKAVNLDGGGSTTMVNRPLGEFGLQLSHPTEYGSTMRQVSNGLGIFTTAPQGSIKGIKASGPGVLFLGQSASYELKAYDQYYNPLDPAGLGASWSSAGIGGNWGGNTFTASKPGTGSITVKSGAASDKLAVSVVGAEAIQSMSIGTSQAALEVGAQISVPVTVKLKDGGTYTLPSDSVKWEFQGLTAARSGDKLTVQSVVDGAEIGYAIARYDGFSALLTLAKSSGSKGLADFDSLSPTFAFASTTGVTGSTELASGLDATNGTNALRLNYDFTAGTTDTRAAYAVLQGSGLAIDGEPTSISVDVLGDASLNWARAELTDAAGTKHLLTLSKAVDWTGWRTFKVPLAESGKAIKYPVKLTRLYIASLKDGADERTAAGSIAFDNIQAEAPSSIPVPVKVKIEMKAGSKTAMVDGKTTSLDSAPYIKDGVTYLPLRFVASSLGSSVNYEAASKRVSVLRGGKLLELVIGSKELVSNGQRIAAPAAPIERGGRTLVPIRLVSEQMGLSVKWDKMTKRITVE